MIIFDVIMLNTSVILVMFSSQKESFTVLSYFVNLARKIFLVIYKKMLLLPHGICSRESHCQVQVNYWKRITSCEVRS